MRTLISTNGRVGSREVAEVERCFADAAEEGFWLDIENPDADDYRLLEETFKFHPLTIEDIRHQNQRPKLDEYPDYNFAVIFQADWRGGRGGFSGHHLFFRAPFLLHGHPP